MLAGIAAVCGYLLGSVPWGLVLTRMAGLGDIREIGSGNIGATNVLRTGHKFLALLTLVLDASKGAVAALIFMQFRLLVAGAFKYSSMASILSILASPVIAMWFGGGNQPVAIMAAGLAVLSIIRHKDNIRRLFKGEESRIGQKKAEKKAESEDTPPSS